MTKEMKIISAAVLFAFALAGCALFTPPAATPKQMQAELSELQGLIPVLQAGLSVATAQDLSAATASTVGRAGIRTVNANAVFGASPPTPQQLVTSGTADSSGRVRYPSDAGTYLQNFYGTEGNQAEFYVKPYDDTNPALATIFEVKLYIYPTFSTTVHYTFEDYLVGATDTGWQLVDASGNLSPVNYLQNQTVYFDGTVEQHQVVSNTLTGTSYAALFDDSSGSSDLDLASSSYDFPPGGDLATAPTTGDSVYSAKVVSTIAGNGTSVVEYYTEVSDGSGGVVKSAVSYVTKDYASGKLGESSTTVRRYIEYPDGQKTVRAVTDSTTSVSGIDSTPRVITEAVDIAPDGGGTGIITYASTTTATSDSTQLYSTVVDLTETAAGSGSYTGTTTYTTASGTDSYTVTLDNPGDPTTTAGTMTVGGQTSTVFYPVSQQDAKQILADLKSGGSFSGILKGNVISGLYQALRSDDSTLVEAALSYIYTITGNSVSLY